jgi:hypothetical protein
MSAFVKFQKFIEALAEKKHNLGSDQLKIALSNSLPDAATAGELADITEIAYTNLSAREITTGSSAQTSGTYKLVLDDLTLTASGNVAPFRYVILYNDTASNDDLIAFFDYGSTISMVDTETFNIDFDASLGILTIA